jgi:hypothetical protein
MGSLFGGVTWTTFDDDASETPGGRARPHPRRIRRSLQLNAWETDSAAGVASGRKARSVEVLAHQRAHSGVIWLGHEEPAEVTLVVVDLDR